MNDIRMEKSIREIRAIGLTKDEKGAMTERILTTHQPVRSPLSILSIGAWAYSHRWTSVLSVFVLVVLVSFSTVVASRSSLPGSPLYSVKVGFVEPLKVAMAVSPAGKAEMQAEIIQRRFEEAEALAVRGKLDDSREQKILALLERHVELASARLAEVQEFSPEMAEEVNITLLATMDAHARLLGDIVTEKVADEVIVRADNIARIIDSAYSYARRFDSGIAMAVANSLDKAASFMSVAGDASGTSFEASSLAMQEEPATPLIAARSAKLTSPQTDDMSDVSSREDKRQLKEREIYEKARGKILRELTVAEIGRSDR